MATQREDTCPVCATADLVCGKWTILILRDLAEGSCRFCELERSLAGISPRTLSLRLRALEEEGVVTEGWVLVQPSEGQIQGAMPAGGGTGGGLLKQLGG